MARTVKKEWIGKDDNTAIPARVKDRLLLRANGRCESCGFILVGQAVEFDHRIALINWVGEGHGNRESNLWVIGRKCCHIQKTKRDVATKSLAARKRKGLNKLKRVRRPVPGSKASGWKHKMDGTWVKRD